MLTLKGTSINIKEPLLGRVSFSPVWEEERSQTVIVNSHLFSRKDLRNYVALIAPSMDVETEMPAVCVVKGIESLSDGDVVEIFPNGVINVLHQVKSKHNIIFVTSKCDSNCIMCPQPVDENEKDLIELNLRLISLISKSTNELALTGGEPAIMGNDLFKLIF